MENSCFLTLCVAVITYQTSVICHPDIKTDPNTILVCGGSKIKVVPILDMTPMPRMVRHGTPQQTVSSTTQSMLSITP
jgi:hypothetical protein